MKTADSAQWFHGLQQALVAGASIASALAMLSLLLLQARRPLPGGAATILGASAGAITALVAGLIAIRVRVGARLEYGTTPIAVLIVGATFLALSTAYQIAAYLAIPADILSYSESGYINDILRLRLGLPIYAPPVENQSTVYTPGSPLLTYAIASAVGRLDSIPFLRIIQFSYVVAASVLAALACDLLARQVIPAAANRQRGLWFAVALPVLFLVATESRFNAFNQSLNSDGLALFVSMAAFCLVLLHALNPRPWLLVAMAAVPAAGFVVKQPMLIWLGAYTLYLIVAGNVKWTHVAWFVVGGAALAAGAIAGCYLLWGDSFLFWTLGANAIKTVSLARSAQHLLDGGLYAAMALFAAWILLTRVRSRVTFALWLSWAAMHVVLGYTSGFAWAHNHIGPTVVIATCWFIVTIRLLWPGASAAVPWWPSRVQQGLAVLAVLCVLGGLGFAREPRSAVPPDVFRYVDEIEREFVGVDPGRVLMDYGTWIYLRENVVVRDRGFATHVHLEENQPVNHAMLADTISRISIGTYDKILVRELDSTGSSYDFHFRGTGAREAIHANYTEVRRIKAVQNVRQWWPRAMLAEIQIFERTRPRTGEQIVRR
jgi:hypothetical protein